MAKRLSYSMEKTDMATKNQKKNTQIKDSIPHHVIEGILLKLPPKSLIRFKSLSKSWHDTISSPFFSRPHLQNNKTNPPLIVAHDRKTLSMLALNNNKVGQNALTLEEHLNIQSEFTGRQINLTIESGSDSILRIRADAKLSTLKRTNSQHIELVLWNPCIRKHKILTVPKIEHAEVRFGIGYDQSIDDYKIIKFGDRKNSIHLEVEVLTLKSNQWRPVSYDLSYTIDIWSRPVSVKGVMYWLANLKEEDAIVCFDLANETFSVELPPIGCQRISGLMELEGKLGCFCETPNSSGYDCFDVWVMEDQNWVSRLITISNTFTRIPIGLSYVGDRADFLGLPDVDVTFQTNVKHKLFSFVYGVFQPIIWCAASLIGFD